MLRLFVVFLTLGLTACASTGAIPRPFPTPAGSSPASPAAPETASEPLEGTRSGYALAGTALSLRGVPYRNGGSDPAGFDCSGLVWYVFTQHGIRMPRTVAEQYRSGTDAGGRPASGDLVFFSTTAPGPSHVGILLGGDEFVHAPSTSGEVRVERMSAPYWASRYVGARRITP